MFSIDSSGLRKLARDLKKLEGTIELDTSKPESSQVDQVVRHFKRGGVDMDRSEARRIVRDATKGQGGLR